MSWIRNTAFLSLEWARVPSNPLPQANIGKTKWHTKKKELREERETATMALLGYSEGSEGKGANLQEKPSALNTEHPALFYYIFVGHFCSYASGSRDPAESGSNPDLQQCHQGNQDSTHV
jgi:hypothetical protein